MSELKSNEASMMSLLNLNILLQFVGEELDLIPSSVNKREVKKASNDLLRAITPFVNNQYSKMFLIDEEMTQNISWELSNLIKRLSLRSLPEKIELEQLFEAHSLDSGAMIESAHRIIKKHNK